MAGGVCALFRLEENVILILLKCSENQSWGKTFVERKWLSLKEEMVQSLLELHCFKLLNFRLRHPPPLFKEKKQMISLKRAPNFLLAGVTAP